MSSATTVSRSARCKRWPPSTSSMPVRSADPGARAPARLAGVPDRLTEAVASAKARSDAHTSSFEQLTLAEFITSGPTTGTCAASGSPTGAAATASSPRSRRTRPCPRHGDRGRTARGRRTGPRPAGRTGHRPRRRPRCGDRRAGRVRAPRAHPRTRTGHRLRHSARTRLHHRPRPARRGDPGPVMAHIFTYRVALTRGPLEA